MAEKKKYPYVMTKDYEYYTKKYYVRDIPLPGRGFYKKTLVSVPEFKEHERYREPEHYLEILRECIKCGTCRYVYRDWSRICPSGEYGGFETYYLGGKNLLLRGLLRGEIKPTPSLIKRFYHCTLCGACQVQCQIAEIHNNALEWLEGFREMAVNKGWGPMPRQKMFGEHIVKEHNPYMELHKDRLNWLPSSSSLPEKADIVFFVGCTSTYRQTNIAKATVEILQGLGINFTVMKDEWCCGSPAQRTGQRKIAEDCAHHNLEEIKKIGATTVVTSCAGCYRMFKEDYVERYGLEHGLEIVHTPNMLLNLVKKGKLKFTKELKMKVTYHDPCHTGRHMGIYNEPRELLRSIPGIELVEMPRNRENAWCCGHGGGVRADFPDLALFAASERLKEAKATGAEAITSTCPFCYRSFLDGIKETYPEYKVYDVVELVRMAM